MLSQRSIIAAVTIGVLTQSSLAENAVPDAAKAMKIGAAAIKAKLDEKAYFGLTRDRMWQAILNGNVWYVWAEPKPEPPQPCRNDSNLVCVAFPTNGNWFARVSRLDGHIISVRRELQP